MVERFEENKNIALSRMLEPHEDRNSGNLRFFRGIVKRFHHDEINIPPELYDPIKIAIETETQLSFNEKAELFRILTKGYGKGKSHCSNFKIEGAIKKKSIHKMPKRSTGNKVVLGKH